MVLYAIQLKLSTPLVGGGRGSGVGNIKIIEMGLFRISVHSFLSSRRISLILLGFHNVLCPRILPCWGWVLLLTDPVFALASLQSG